MLLPYRKKDLTPCVEIFVAAFGAPPLNYDFITREKARRYLRDLASAPGFVGYVYEAEGELVGLCFGKLDDYFHAPLFTVDELAVLPGLHGKGLGKAIMSAVEEELAQKGVKEVALQTSTHIPAYRFYRKLGYSRVENTVSLTKPI